MTRIFGNALGILIAVALFSTSPAWAVAGNLPGGTALSVDLTAPAANAVIQSTQASIPLQGSAAVGEGVAVANTLIVYVLDVSGSVNAVLGCGGDANGDGHTNTVLDCEIAAALALNADAIAAGSVGQVGVVAFSGLAAAGDVSPAPGVQTLTTPATDANGANGPDVAEVLRSAIAQHTGSPTYGLRVFSPVSSGSGSTNYSAGIQAAVNLVNLSSMPNKLVVFMSDGNNTAGTALAGTGAAAVQLRAAVANSGAIFHTFAVGSNTGFSCTTNSSGRGSLLDVAQLSQPDGTCTEVATVANLPTIVPDLILAELTSLSFTVDDGAPQDMSAAAGLPLPQAGPATVPFATEIPNLPVGPHQLCVTAQGSDAGGTGSVTHCVNLTVNGSPIAVDDGFTVAEDTPLVVPAPGLLDNDDDPNGDALTAELIAGPANGALALNPDGSFTYTPARHFDGVDSFTYQARDGQGVISAAAAVTITVTPDAYLEVTSLCEGGPGSLRAAMEGANSAGGVSTIVFDIIDGACGSDGVIYLVSLLPPITAPVVIDGALRDDGSAQTPTVVLDGSGAGATANGLVITGSGQGSTVNGLTLRNFAGSGVVIGAPGAPSNGNTVANSTLAFNGDDGVTILAGVDNRVLANDIHDNGDQAIDLGGDGRTPNDLDDLDEGANYVQNYPVLFRATPIGPDATLMEGWLDSRPGASYSLQFFAGPTCDAGDQSVLPVAGGADTIITDENGEAYFQVTVAQAITLDWAIRATATDPAGNTSDLSDCVLASIDNDSWPRALRLTPDASAPAVASVQGVANGQQTWTVRQYLDQSGQARWYRFPVQPDSRIQVTLSGLPANYDLALYRDIGAVYEELVAPANEDDLHRLGAEFAPSAFSPSAFSPSAFSPSAFSPSAFSPSAFSPSAFSPSAFSPSAFSPSAFSPSAFSPSAFSPSAFSPSAFSPSAFSPSAFSPSAFSPSAFSPSDFSSAQMRSLVGVSAIDGTANEQLQASTWANTGDFYVRVRGREGEFSLTAPFDLTITLSPSGCDATVFATLPSTSIAATAGGYRTLILTDLGRMNADTGALQQALATLAARPEVQGAVVDVAGDARVAAANALADGAALRGCPYAKNVVAQAIKQIVDAYRTANPGLEYIVVVGNDDVIPFFRYPDSSLLGDESNFFPPVQDDTASQASLRRSYVLSQDAYGADLTLSLNGTELPIPRLAVGRLVETPADIVTLLAAYLSTPDGVVPTPSSALVTGYDFLEDASLAVRAELQAGIGAGATVDSLITPRGQSPLAPTLAEGGQVWTAQDLDTLLRNNRYDLAFLAGHFNANSALAADFATSLISTDVRDFAADMTNSIIFSVGCHSGYNIVDEHGIPGVTFEPDWTQVFAQRGATLIAGTGYQYGDTEFLEYSERLYLQFTRELRTGAGPVPVGNALVRAKQHYLETTPSLRGIHEKSLLEATLFGLPMIRVNMPGERITPSPTTSVIAATDPAAGGPGASLGLRTADLGVAPSLTTRVKDLTNVEPSDANPAAIVRVQWLRGGNGVVTNAAEPALPLEVRNVSAPQPGLVLRGVGLRGGQYSDLPDIIPYTGAPTTEMRGVHSPFLSDVWYPLRLWNVNYFGELTGTDAGTQLVVTPVQHRSTFPGSQTSTLRSYSSLDLRLFYSGEVDDDPSETGSPGASAPPAIVNVQSIILPGNAIAFQVRAVGNPAAGMQDVWVTYTGAPGSALYGQWRSLDLIQDAQDSTLWAGQLDLGAEDPAALRYIVQAANGVGLVATAENLGRYYRAGETGAVATTTLTLEPFAAGGAFGGTATFAATLRDSNGPPLADQMVYFALGVQVQVGRTDGSGRAQVQIPLLGQPGAYDVRATFPGSESHAASSTDGSTPFTITRQATATCLDSDLDNDCDDADRAAGRVASGPVWMAAILEDASAPPRRQIEQAIFFEITGDGGTTLVPATTDFNGRATLRAVPLAPGQYSVVASYPGTPPLQPSRSEPYLLTIPAANQPPACSAAYVDPATIWPPNKKLVPVTILGVLDPDGGAVTIRVDAVCQDEAVSKQGDAVIQGSGAQVRADRDGKGNGRAYQIDFTATDGAGASCQGSVLTIVPHDRGRVPADVAGEMLYNSVNGSAAPACRPASNMYSAAGAGSHAVYLPLISVAPDR